MAATIVFIGDSITDAGRREDPEGLGHGYVRLVADELANRGDGRAIVKGTTDPGLARSLYSRYIGN